MYRVSAAFIFLLLISCGKEAAHHKQNGENPHSDKQESNTSMGGPALIIHGGAGTILKDKMSDSLVLAYESALDSALQIGYAVLEADGKAIDAVIASIQYMENNPLFNAGKGSVLNAKGEVEMDASLMEGSDLSAGAVAGLQNVRSAIQLARFVKDSTNHVLLSGSGLKEFARTMNVQSVQEDYFLIPKRRKQREELLKTEKYGTVGAVALDKDGHIAAGTSTGGMHAKRYGRIGDSPIIGAGTYANDKSLGVSCTGHGEFFIKNAVAYDMHALYHYLNYSVDSAAREILHHKLVQQEALGGLIALDKDGNIIADFNTPGMFRAWKRHDGLEEVHLFSE